MVSVTWVSINDAYRYTGTTHHHAEYDYKQSPAVKVKDAYTEKTHPEHHDLAVQAHNVHVHGHPDGSSWDRERKARENR